MFTRAATRPYLSMLAFLIAAVATVPGCKRAEREEPAKPAPAPAPVKEAPARSKEQAMQALLALPELTAWSAQIERRSKGKAHGAVIEDNPIPREINGKKYYQLTFVENRPESAHRRENFLVSQTGDEILVEEADTDKLLTLQEWRRKIKRVELKSAD